MMHHCADATPRLSLGSILALLALAIVAVVDSDELPRDLYHPPTRLPHFATARRDVLPADRLAELDAYFQWFWSEVWSGWPGDTTIWLDLAGNDGGGDGRAYHNPMERAVRDFTRLVDPDESRFIGADWFVQVGYVL